ncbi:MAG TPA: helix-turn-helix domain-containing protein [Solirubrobacterales bacterium]|nr:helix-turn-helix domain-containing protein [Solirubrobacterales bacterium]
MRATPSRGEEKRPYRKRRRAEQEEETRLRITEAAVELHGSVGPARTTISAVAEKAGVQRATVYRHFPDEVALFGACSAHWAMQHPLPDVEVWAAIADPEERLRVALGQLYAWFADGEEMLENVIRDGVSVPAMQGPVEAVRAWLAYAAEALLRGRPERGRRRLLARAAIGHALAFETWRSLVREQGLSQEEAVELMVALAAHRG